MELYLGEIFLLSTNYSIILSMGLIDYFYIEKLPITFAWFKNSIVTSYQLLQFLLFFSIFVNPLLFFVRVSLYLAQSTVRLTLSLLCVRSKISQYIYSFTKACFAEHSGCYWSFCFHYVSILLLNLHHRIATCFFLLLMKALVMVYYNVTALFDIRHIYLLTKKK